MAYASESTNAGRTDPSSSGTIKTNGHAVPDGAPSEQSTPLPRKFAHLHEDSTPTPSRTASPRRSNSALGTRPHDGHDRFGRAPTARAKSRGEYKLSWLFPNNRDTGESGRFHIGLFGVLDLVKGCTAADLHMEGNSAADGFPTIRERASLDRGPAYGDFSRIGFGLLSFPCLPLLWPKAHRPSIPPPLLYARYAVADLFLYR